MDSIRRFLGLDREGRGVSSSTSLLYSLILSLLISVGLRFLFPAMAYPVRFILFIVVVFAVFSWINKNHRDNTRGCNGPK
ncbi:hypothetical protein ACFSYH_07480 [Populibacterium corticicola]|uniref:Uncharacterized protein n=1 Tax=Populibacterium corticicola TaxID=1812826 RepID=A0ABW5XFB2_9MICO